MINKMYPPENEVISPKPKYKFKLLERKYDFLRDKRASLEGGLKVYGG